MGEMMMVEKQALVLDDADLPLFYMNDFSVLGLVVPKLSQAIDVLKSNGYQVACVDSCAKIRFNNRVEFNALLETLDRHHIEFGTADLVSYAYQG